MEHSPGRPRIAIFEEGDIAVIVTTPRVRAREVCADREQAAAPLRTSPLTASELAVAKLVARGFSNAEIARARKTAARTVANQVASALAKLGLSSRVALGAWWGNDGSS